MCTKQTFETLNTFTQVEKFVHRLVVIGLVIFSIAIFTMTDIYSNGKWILRPARFSDFRQISLFHSQGTFESLDYMAVTYHKLLQDKNSNAFVATTCDGKVVSKSCGLKYFVDDNEQVDFEGDAAGVLILRVLELIFLLPSAVVAERLETASL